MPAHARERSALRVVAVYAVFAALWILVSDRVLEWAVPEHESYAFLGTLKGLVFVAATAALLWVMLRYEFRALGSATRALAESEQALTRSAASLARAQQVAHLGSWVWHIPTDSLEWSDEMFRIFGVDRATFTGRLADVVAASIHPDDRPRVEAVNRAVIERGATQALEYRVVWPDGTVRTVRAEAADSTTDAAGTIVTLSGVVQDITERKALEQQVLRVQRMEAVGALASGISHDLNNILTPILMVVPLLREHTTDPADREMLDTVEQCATRGASVIRQLLTFARGEPAAWAPLPMRHLLREIEKLARETFPRDIEVETTVAVDLWTAHGDVTQMHQVLLNLCINARDAMGDRGRLRVTAGNVTVVPGSPLEAHGQAGTYVCVSVSDTGAGIAPEHVDRIFDPFFTTKEVGKGTGLGLATVLGIVRGHHGFIRVDSHIGFGTVFEVYLPAEVHAAPTHDAPAPAAADLAGHGRLVLLVDDEASVRSGVEHMLVAAGYRVVTAANGVEALATFERHRADVRVVLTDMMMPLLGGAGLVRALRDRGARTPVVTMSGLFEPDAASRHGEIAAALAKPFTPAMLLGALGKALEEREEGTRS